MTDSKKRVLIMGAAGRDFHNFNVFFRANPTYEVVAFTATQIPDIAGRKYPPELSGDLYPNGIPIYDEADLSDLIEEHEIDVVVFAYSDVKHDVVMNKASRAMAAGADFLLLGPNSTMVKSTVPLISICAVRTGCGKSQTTRRVCELLKATGKTVVAIRHPMPYGDLAKQACQRFATYDDLDTHECTIEEREEYEPHIDMGIIVYAGVDYEQILREAEKEADVIIWDGGNNDVSFYHSDLYITIADPHRPGHELTYHPGETNLRLADVVIINKIKTAKVKNIEKVRENIKAVNPTARIITAESPLEVEDPDMIKGKRVLVVEDGPTVTHGGMGYGAGYIAAENFGAAEFIDPRPFAVGSIDGTFKKYPHLEKVLPAMGYSDTQIEELETTINRSDCDVVIGGTPINLERVIDVEKPMVRVHYSLREVGELDLKAVLKNF